MNMPMASVSSRVKALLLTATALSGAGDFMFGAVYVSFLQLIPLDGRTIGMLLALATGVSLVFEAPSGAIADRYGHKWMMLAGMLLWVAGLIALSFAASAVVAGGGTAALDDWNGAAIGNGLAHPS